MKSLIWSLLAVFFLSSLPSTVIAQLPSGGDENVTVTIRDMGLGPTLPDDVISRYQVRINRIDPDKPVGALEGYELFWVYLVMDRIDGIVITSLPKAELIDSAGTSHPVENLQWSGLEMLDLSDMTAGYKLVVGGSGFAWFGIREGTIPASLSLSYQDSGKAADNPGKPKERKKSQSQWKTFEVALTDDTVKEP
jgi:hypothetical protein